MMTMFKVKYSCYNLLQYISEFLWAKKGPLSIANSVAVYEAQLT